MARLIVLAGSNLGESYELGQTNSLGSGDANAVIIPDPEVSEYHAQLSQIKKRYYIVNLTVSDTIEVNGREVEKIMISNGDSLKLGSTMFLFSDEHQQEEPVEDVLAESADLKELDFGKYKIVNEISRGANAVVYKAVQKGLDRVVALKVLLSGEHAGREEINRFYTEARSVASLTHPNIVPIFDIGIYNKRHYFAMEYIEGDTLGGALLGKKISPLRGLKAIEQVAGALAYAHKRSIVHRDIKPTNILIDPFGKALLSDFGIAKQLGGGNKTNTQTGQALGTPAYMAPEQAEGKIRVSPRADIYSLGAVLYEIFTGQKPYDAPSAAAILMKLLTEDPIPPQKINQMMNPDVATIISKAMERDPERRYQSVKAMADDISAFRRGQQIKAKPTSRYYHLVQVVKKNAVVITAMSIAVLSTLVSIAYMSYTTSNNKRQIHKIEVEKEKVVLQAEKAAKQTKREETSRWHLADEASKNDFTNWKIDPLKGAKKTITKNPLHFSSAKPIKLIYDESHAGNIEIDFTIQTVEKETFNLLTGFIGNNPSSGLQFRFGKWQNYEMVIMRSGKILAMREVPPPLPGQIMHFSFRMQGLEALLSVRYDEESPYTLLYRGFEMLRIPYNRRAGLDLRKASGALENIRIQYEDLPLKPTRLEFAHTYFFKRDLKNAFSDYMQISKSPTYQSDPISIEALYYAGLTHQAERRYNDAAELFLSILNSKNKDVEISNALIEKTILQATFSLAQMGKLEEASEKLLSYVAHNKAKAITTPWEWALIELLPKYYNTGYYREALELLRSINWSDTNVLLLKEIKSLAYRIRREDPKLIAPLLRIYPDDSLNPYLRESFTYFYQKKDWIALKEIYEILEEGILTPDAETLEALQRQFILSIQRGTPNWQTLASYFYTNIASLPSGTNLHIKVQEAFDAALQKNEIIKCFEIYTLWPMENLFAQLVDNQLRQSSDSISPFLEAYPRNQLLPIELLMETGKWNEALESITALLKTPHLEQNTLLLYRALLFEILESERKDEAWENLAQRGDSYESKIAQLFTGDMNDDLLHTEYSLPKAAYKIDFYAGFKELKAGNYPLANELMQRSLTHNQYKQWPYRLCATLLLKIPAGEQFNSK